MIGTLHKIKLVYYSHSLSAKRLQEKSLKVYKYFLKANNESEKDWLLLLWCSIRAVKAKSNKSLSAVSHKISKQLHKSDFSKLPNEVKEAPGSHRIVRVGRDLLKAI